MIDSTKISSYIAGDVYEIWQAAINRATDEILVVTPYFNKVLKDLIESKLKSSNFEHRNIKILTRFSSELAWGNKEQLSVGIELIKMGVELRQLNNLHAKLLIVDKIELVLGSQNFTNNGRQAKEASVSVWYMSENTNYDDFLTSIDVWWKEATPVRVELLTELLKNLEDLENSIDFIKEYRNNNSINFINEYRKNASELFDKFHNDCHEKYEIKIVDNKTSTNEEIRGRIQLDSKSRKIIKITSDCKLGEPLERLNFYPMFIKPINRLVYARVGETQISFVIDSVNQENIPIKMDGISYFSQTSFLEDDFNINIKLVNKCGIKNKDFRFKFDGESLISEALLDEYDLIKSLGNIIFESFELKKPFLRNCYFSGELFPLYQDLKFTVQTTHNNSKILICNY